MADAHRLRILGIDPGSLLVGYGCVEVTEQPLLGAGVRPLALAAANVIQAGQVHGDVAVVDLGILRLGRPTTPIADRLLALWRQVSELMARCGAAEVALEEAFYGKSASASLRIGESRGVILAAARAQGLAVHQFAPARVKRAVSGHGAASKQGVARLVCLQLGIAIPEGPPDVTDALAVALCRAEQRRSVGLGVAEA